MNKDVLEEGLSLLRKGVEANIFYLIDMKEETRQVAQQATDNFKAWCDDNPVECQFLEDNFVD